MKLIVMGRQRGFSLTELVMIMVITAILAVYAVARIGDTASSTGSTQAQQFARDLRHAQMLAMTLGKQLCVNAAGSSYSVSDTTAGSPPTCNAGAMTDPTSYALTAGGSSWTIDVRRVTGLVEVSP